MIELDLSGRKVSVSPQDLEWLRVRAAEASGRSSPASELANRLAGLQVGQPRLVFSRAESRALGYALKTDDELPPGLIAVNELVQRMFPG